MTSASGTADARRREGAKPLLTVVVPVKNEARNLPACLASLTLPCRLVVVDSGSTDETVRIALSAGAQVIDFDWRGGFPKKRNWVLQTHAFDTEWVLFLDADERMTPSFARELEGALRQTEIVGYWLSYRNHFMGRVLRHGVPQRKLALFRVGAGLYERIEDDAWTGLDMEVHEHPTLAGAVGAIATPLEHEDVQGLHKFLARHNDYSSWEAQRYVALAADIPAWGALTARQRRKYESVARWWFAPAYFVFTYVVRAGFLDGRAGLAYALLKASYFIDVRLKILELNTNAPEAAGDR